MPAISMFYGIIVYMYYFDDMEHHAPHVHVRYSGSEAVFRIPDGACLGGELPSKQYKLMQAWIAIRHEELLADWQLAIEGKELFRVDPLK